MTPPPSPTPRRRRTLVVGLIIAALATGCLLAAAVRSDRTLTPSPPSSASASVDPSRPATPARVSVRAVGATGDGRTDDRPALQKALDLARRDGSDVWIPAGTYLLASATQPGDRILRTYPNQRIRGAGRGVVTLRVAPSFGGYVTVLGAASDRTDIGRWELSGLTIDQNAADNQTAVSTITVHPQMAIRLGSYRPGSRVTVHSSGLLDADGLNGFYLFAQDVDVIGCVFERIGGRADSPVHDHSTVYTASVVDGGTQTITGSSFTAVEGGGAARSAVDTHGSRQVITGNRIVDYLHGINLTGMAQIATGPVLVEDNQLVAVAVGVELWVRRRADQPSRRELSNVTVRGNVITSVAASRIRPDQPQERGAVLVNSSNDSPVWGLTVEGNTVADADPLVPDPDLAVVQCVTREPDGVHGLEVVGNVVPPPIERLLAPECRGALSRLADNRLSRK